MVGRVVGDATTVHVELKEYEVATTALPEGVAEGTWVRVHRDDSSLVVVGPFTLPRWAGQDKLALVLLASMAVLAVGAALGSVLNVGAGGVLVVFGAGMAVRWALLMRA